MILVDRTSNGRPGVIESKDSLHVVSNQFLPAFLKFSLCCNQEWCTKPTDLSRHCIEDSGFDAEERNGRWTWFRFNRTRERCDDDGSRLRLPNSISQRHKKSTYVKLIIKKKTNQKVSTIAHCFLTTCSLYQFHASGLIGSPTLPRTRKLLKSWPWTCCSPSRRNKRMAVGAE
jgi:hypothetical protein